MPLTRRANPAPITCYAQLESAFLGRVDFSQYSRITWVNPEHICSEFPDKGLPHNTSRDEMDTPKIRGASTAFTAHGGWHDLE